jgi:hypothetical protein
VGGVFNGFQSFIPQRGANNGQAQMAQTPLQNQGASLQNQNPQPQANVHEVQNPQALPQGATGMAQTGADVGGQQITPEQQALSLLIDHCRQNIPARIAFSRLCNYADYLNDNAPHLSIDEYITMLGAAPTDSVIEYVKTLPGGEQIAALPHAKEWTSELQRLIKESQEGEES